MTAAEGVSRAGAPSWPRIAHVLAPAGVYLGVRGVGVGVLALMAGPSRLVPELTSWDASWLLAIAEHGYDGVPTDMRDAFGNHPPDTPLGFFPGYPALVAAVGVLTAATSSSPACSSPPWRAWPPPMRRPVSGSSCPGAPGEPACCSRPCSPPHR